ncbi:MAG: phenylacetic acid degradation protein PaaY [Nitrospira bacterium SG8_3]|nr:MAG: phenylacetic acid degradation protein PaaY [Nitrospira bacterium SG8_3]
MPVYEFEGKRPSIHSKAFVHPDAIIIGDVVIEADCYVGAGAVLRGQENCVIHAFPDKSAIVHPNSHIGHGAILHGCEICSNVLVGMRAIIADGVKINSHSFVGAGSFVAFDQEIPPNSLVVGSPAKVIQKVSPEHLERIKNGLDIYQDLTRRHLKSFREIPVEEVKEEGSRG